MIEKKTIKVLIVDDSRVARAMLTHIIESDPDLKVAGYAENGEIALQWLQKEDCDVITMDIHMPVINGFEVTKKIMETKPLPTIIISSGYDSHDNHMAFKAIEAGALAILEKPVGIYDVSYSQMAKEIIHTIKMVSGIKLLTRHPRIHLNENKNFLKTAPKLSVKAIGIGASLGGPLAIAKILEDLPASFPIPIFIVQHIAAGFTEDFIRWLQNRAKLKIYLAKHGELAQPGCVYIAADVCQMGIKKGDIINLDYTTLHGIQPSVGHLFKSLAETYGAQCIGVILTGMGRDGAEELLLMKQKGAYTIAQDEESCLMFGMPKEAILINAAQQIVPLNLIASTLIRLVEK